MCVLFFQCSTQKKMLGLYKLQKKQHQNSTVKTYAAKVCSNCKYFRPNVEYYYVDDRFKHRLCIHPESKIIDGVSGDVDYNQITLMRYCKNHCGPDAQFYEADTKLFVILKIIRAYIHIREIMTIEFTVFGMISTTLLIT